MNSNISNQRFYASLLVLGGAILLYRTIVMISQGMLEVLVSWVAILLVIELLFDSGCIISSIIWYIKNDSDKALIPLRIAAAAIILHAFRVLIFVLGRIGPWINFDIQPQYRAHHHTSWTWAGVYFAAIMSLLGVIGVIIIWQVRRRATKI